MAGNAAALLLDATRLVWRRWAGVRPTGIDRICLAWMDHFAPRSQAVIVRRQGPAILSEAASQRLFALLAEPDTSITRPVFRSRLAALVLRHGASLIAGRKGHDRLWLNAGHTGLDVPGLAEWCRRAGVRPVYLVHDLIPISHPQFCREGEAERHRRRMHTVLSSGHGIVANSADTLGALGAFARETHLPPPPSVVAWPGTPRLPLVLRPDAPDRPTFVMLGTIEGRKNHMLMLDVWEKLRHAYGALAPRLLIIGRRGWACDDVLARLDAGRNDDLVLEAGALNDADIARHLAGARALLFPSFVEGYGLPLAEALASGVPVIASDLPVFREIGHGVPDLLSPGDAMAWQQAVADYAAATSPRRDAQLQRMKGYSAPDWPGHFRIVDAFLAQLGC